MALSLFNNFPDFSFTLPYFYRAVSGEHTDMFGSVDIHETHENTTFKMDLPGISAEDINVQVNADLLTVSGSRNYEKTEPGLYFERSYGNFSRSFHLPPNTDDTKVSATLDQGVLTIIVSKFESDSHTIPVIDNSKGDSINLDIDKSKTSQPRRSNRNRTIKSRY